MEGKFDLEEVRKAIEERYDVVFSKGDFAGNEAIVYKTKSEELTVHIGTYKFDAKYGQNYIGVDYWSRKNQGGFGVGYDTLESAIKGLKRVLKERDIVQMTLF